MKRKPETAVVTGASSGIGRETAGRLAGLGYRVIAVARRLDRLNDLAKKTEGIIPYRLDLSLSNEVREFCRYLRGLKPPVTVLINNAGYGLRGVIEDVKVEDAKNLFQVNLFSIIQITSACIPAMRKEKRGTIINLSSVSGKVAFPMSGLYAASKHAVEAVTDALRMEVRPFGIRVIAIRPGSISTEFNNLSKELAGDSGTGIPADYRKFHATLREGFRKIFAGKTLPGPGPVADMIIEALESPTPKPVYTAGFVLDEFMGARSRMNDEKFHGFMIEKTGLAKIESGNLIVKRNEEAGEENIHAGLYVADNFSRREKEVLKYLVKGMTNGEISRRMGIKASSVKSHIDNIFNKMGVSNRTTAAVLAVLNNLVS